MIELIKKNKKMTINEIALTIGLTREGVNYHIKKLKEKNMLVRVGSDSVGHWQIRNEIDNPRYLEKLSEEEQIILINWCKGNFEERKTFNRNHTSHGLKRIFAKNNFYTTMVNSKVLCSRQDLKWKTRKN